jgi:toxin FitB
VKWLVDTNVLSELRKKARCNPGVLRWAEGVSEESMVTSVLVIGEIRRGVDRVARKDPAQSRVLRKWLDRVRIAFAGRTLEITEQIAEEWGRLDAFAPRPIVDALLAATAKVHGLTLVTRNTVDFESMGIDLLDPFKK